MRFLLPVDLQVEDVVAATGVCDSEARQFLRSRLGRICLSRAITADAAVLRRAKDEFDDQLLSQYMSLVELQQHYLRMAELYAQEVAALQRGWRQFGHLPTGLMH